MSVNINKITTSKTTWSLARKCQEKLGGSRSSTPCYSLMRQFLFQSGLTSDCILYSFIRFGHLLSPGHTSFKWLHHLSQFFSPSLALWNTSIQQNPKYWKPKPLFCACRVFKCYPVEASCNAPNAHWCSNKPNDKQCLFLSIINSKYFWLIGNLSLIQNKYPNSE